MYLLLELTADEALDCYQPTLAITDQDDMSEERRSTLKMLKAHPDFAQSKYAADPAFQRDLECVAYNVRKELLEFACYMCLAHWSSAQREAREHKIDAEFERYLGASRKTGVKHIDSRLEVARSRIKTVPDFYLSMLAANVACDARSRRIEEFSAPPPQADQRAYMQLSQLIGQLDSRHVVDEVSGAIQALGEPIVDVTQMSRYCEAVWKLLAHKDVVEKFFTDLWAFHNNEAKAGLSNILDLGWQCIIDCAKSPAESWDSVMRARYAEARTMYFSGMMNEFHATLKAVEANVLFGAKARASSLLILRWFRKKEKTVNDQTRALLKAAGLNLGTGQTVGTGHGVGTVQGGSTGRSVGTGPTPGRGAQQGRQPARGRGARNLPPQPQVSADDAAMREQFAAWSVDQLARWIGPVTKLTKTTKALRPSDVVNDQMKRAAKVTQQDVALDAPGGSPDIASLSTAEEPMAENEVSKIVQDGLRATADFFSADVAKMLNLVTQPGHPFVSEESKRHQAELTGFKEKLNELKGPASISELDAREFFGRVEAALGQLRASVETHQRDQAMLAQFALRLNACLDQEKLSLGRRTGGYVLLNSKNPLDHWGQVSSAFHGRLLTIVDVDEGGVRRRLNTDEALALYVTGSSDSGSAFCVSVHLWRRFENSDAPPAGPDGLTMNTAHWYDTYTSCCVLHVRAG